MKMFNLLNLVRDRAHVRPVVCVELSPLTDEEGWKRTRELIRVAQNARVDFLTMTDTGLQRGTKAIEAAIRLRHESGLPVIAHIACAHRTHDDLLRDLDRLDRGGIDHVLIVRGDIDPAKRASMILSSFEHASDAIRFLRERGCPFTIGAACYPDGHPSHESPAVDLKVMRRKREAGADYFVTQAVFDFARYGEHVCTAFEEEGVAVPVLPGIFVVSDFAKLQRLARYCRVKLPRELLSYRNEGEGDRLMRELVGTARASWVKRAPGFCLSPFGNADDLSLFLSSLFG